HRCAKRAIRKDRGSKPRVQGRRGRGCRKEWVHNRKFAASGEADRNLSLGEITLHVTDRVLAKMKDAGSQDGVRLSFQQDVRHMSQSARATTGNHGNPNI